jgi:hypothetical protein
LCNVVAQRGFRAWTDVTAYVRASSDCEHVGSPAHVVAVRPSQSHERHLGGSFIGIIDISPDFFSFV